MEDVVAEVIRQWHQVDPELDTSPIAVLGRLTRCAHLLQHALDSALLGEGIARPEWELLCALRRVDGELTPGRIARETFSSGAAVTKRLRSLEERGLVRRRPDARDRRVAHLALTEDGRALVDRLLPRQLGYEQGLLSGLDDARRSQLAGGLGELLVLLEGKLANIGM